MKSPLTGRQHRAIACLVLSPSIREAASRAGVGERTLHRWLEQEPFAQALGEARKAAWAKTLETLQAAGLRAVESLVKVLDGADVPPAVKVSAARAVLELAFKSRLEDLEARLQALEAEQATRGRSWQ